MTCGTLLHLNRPCSWPRELLRYLDEYCDLFRRWKTRQSEVSVRAFDQAIQGLRDALQPYHILGWHCTRLTDAEGDDILRNGMQLPDAGMLARRIDVLVKTGEITPHIGRRLASENEASSKSRAGRVWFCFFPPGNAGEHGIGRFFRHWGGEALYVCHESDPVTSPALSCIGTPRIVEAEVPIASLRMYGNLEAAFYCRYLASRDIPMPQPSDYEDCVEQPLSAENVRRVISIHDPDFDSLTGHSEWGRTIPYFPPRPDVS